jgi:hypothetical protein
MSRIVTALAAAWLLAACMPMQWVKADATPEQLNQDAFRCQQEAWQEARLRSWYYQPIGPAVIHDSSGRRIFLGPSAPMAGPFGDSFLEESRLAQFCMQAKGYRLAPLEKLP